MRRRLNELYESSMTVKGTTPQILNKLLEKVAGVLEGKFILVQLKQGDKFIFKADYNLPEELKRVGCQLVKDSICSHVLVSGHPLIIRDLPNVKPWCDYPIVEKYNLKTYFGVPLLAHEGKYVGTLCLMDDKDRKFSDTDIKVMTLFAQKASAEIEREELLDRLKESEERYRIFFEHASEGILVVDIEKSRLIEANYKFRELSKYSKFQLMNMSIYDFRPTRDFSRFDSFTKGLFEGQEKFDDVPIKTGNGELFFADITARAINLNGKKMLHLLLMDITEKKKVLRQMINSERLASLGELSASVAHEINNPMQTILAYSHLLLEDLQHDAKMKEWLQMMVDEASRVKKTVQALLEFARKKEPEFAEVNVNKMVNSSLKLIENRTSTHNIKTEQNLEAYLPSVIGDAAQLQQVFMNIAINAIEAMEKGGILTINTGVINNKFIEISISDTGCGIVKKNIPKLFEPFFSTKQKGTGLGLSVSHGIITNHEGDIRIESELNKGTTVTITLPLKKG